MRDTITITLDRQAAERLAVLWEGDDGHGTEGYADLLRSVRDLFDGQDGFLHRLNDALGRQH